MKNRGQSYITYVRNGSEITKNITKWNRIFLFETIGEQIDERFGFYEFKKDIEYIYLKNVVFSSLYKIKIKLAPHQVLVLDNCVFKGCGINFKQGNVQMIHPVFDYGYITRVEADYVKDFHLILDKNMNREEFLCLDLEAENIEVNTNFSQYLFELRIKYAETVLLKNIAEVIKTFSIEAYQNINLKHSHIVSYRSIFLETEQLYLDNSAIGTRRKNLNSRDIPCLRIDVNNIYGNNYQLVSENSVILNGSVYQKQELQENVILTKDKLMDEGNFESRKKLISVLKGIQKKYQLMYEEYGNKVKKDVVFQLENQQIVNHFPALLKSKVKRK